MTFTLKSVARSLADYLSPTLPGVTFYEGPNQQGTSLPCAFLQQRYSRIKRRQAGRWLRTIGLDMTYLEDYNLLNLQSLYESAAEALDLVMETFPYSDGGSEPAALLRTYDREWKIDADELHYKFELRVWVELPENDAKMQTLCLHQEVTNGKKVHSRGAAERQAFLRLSAGFPRGGPASAGIHHRRG